MSYQMPQNVSDALICLEMDIQDILDTNPWDNKVDFARERNNAANSSDWLKSDNDDWDA